MSEFIVNLPSLGDDAGDSAKVSFVYVNVGDAVAENGDLIEMVTDKATFNVPSPKSGKVAKILVAEDDEVKVGEPICALEI
ncbi:MAG: lipoyl domain-containing protein [Planctomycetota bacterium]|jgi:pyruvate dehydrogenase E2 component (dihydrolipoamide acetyltransferase)|nr:lipoyl domain-containing protein [Planctomycetota bacterium]